jgi:hypothetical protein
MNKKYFSVHSINAMKAKQFSIFRANIENTKDKIELATNIFPSDNWIFEYHDEKKSLKVVL